LRENRSVLLVLAALAAVTLVVTWPLGAELGTSYPGDYGDPLFVTWVMAWVNHHVASLSFEGFWDAGIFFPERNTLAFSEHFIAQSLMVGPVYWSSGNPILAYNLAFVLTFLLTGLGGFLLARALTGSFLAGAVAAFIATFNEYRLVYEIAHLHTLSIHWFVFALFALNRYFVTDRRAYLAGAVASLVLLNLSSIYYMAYCAPFVVVFAGVEALRTGRARALRTWLELWAAAAAVLVFTLPFLLPYIQVQQRLGIERPLEEVVLFSARLEHYGLALPGMIAAVVAAGVGVIGGALTRGLRGVTAATTLLLVLAFWLSLGPVIKSGAEVLDWPALYSYLHTYVPGYSALRVPARFASLFFVFLALAAAIGVNVIERRRRLAGQIAACAVIVVFLLRDTPETLQMNAVLPSPGLVTPPPAYLTPAPSLPAIYRAVETLRPEAILVELPFGDPWYDVRYMFFAATHRRRMLNGYSGVFPPSNLARQRVLKNPLLDLPASAQAMAGATHAIVHRRAWADDTGQRLGAWLEQYEATLVAEADGAALYELPVRENFAQK
jgi:hypothetical protein